MVCTTKIEWYRVCKLTQRYASLTHTDAHTQTHTSWHATHKQYFINKLELRISYSKMHYVCRSNDKLWLIKSAVSRNISNRVYVFVWEVKKTTTNYNTHWNAAKIELNSNVVVCLFMCNYSIELKQMNITHSECLAQKKK